MASRSELLGYSAILQHGLERIYFLIEFDCVHRIINKSKAKPNRSFLILVIMDMSPNVCRQ